MTENTIAALTVVGVIFVALILTLVIAEIRDLMEVKKSNDEYLRSCAELDHHFATVPKD